MKITTQLPFQHKPPNRFIEHQIKRYRDARGTPYAVREAHYLDKKGKHSTVDAQVIWDTPITEYERTNAGALARRLLHQQGFNKFDLVEVIDAKKQIAKTRYYGKHCHVDIVCDQKTGLVVEYGGEIQHEQY